MADKPMLTPKDVPATFLQSFRRIADRDFLLTPAYKNAQLRAIRKDADPRILEFEKAFVKRCHGMGIPMFANEVIRTADRQKMLKLAGRSKTDDGPHMYGMAVDLVHCKFAWDMSVKEWAFLGHIGKEVAQQLGLRIVWGGDWRFYDPAHWEIAQWRQQKSRVIPF